MNRFQKDINVPSGKTYKINDIDILLGKLVSVGTGGDYPTIKDAVDASKYSLVLISDVTELLDIDFGQNNIHINLNGYEMDMVDKKLIIGLNSDLVIANGSVVFADTIGGDLFNGSVGRVILKNVKFTNNSTQSDQYVIRGIGRYYDTDNCEFILPNFARTGIEGDLAGGSIKNSIITGGGVSCTIGGTTGGTTFQKCTLNGTYTTSDWIVRNTFMYNITILASCRLWVNQGIGIRYGSGAVIDVNRVYNMLRDCDLNTGKVTIGTDSQSGKCIIDNVQAGYLDVNTQATKAKITNCDFISEVVTVIDSDEIYLFQTSFNEDVQINSDKVIATNCRIGSLNGGGKTFVITATADSTIITTSWTEAAVSNLGTNTDLDTRNKLF